MQPTEPQQKRRYVRSKPPAKQRGVRVPLPLDRWLEAYARRTHRSLTDTIVLALDTLRVRDAIEMHVRESVQRNASYTNVHQFEDAIKERQSRTGLPYAWQFTLYNGGLARYVAETADAAVRAWEAEGRSEAYLKFSVFGCEFCAPGLWQPPLPFDESPEKNNTDGRFGGHDVGVDRSKPPDETQEAKIE